MGVQSPTEIKASGGWQRCADEDVALMCDAHLAGNNAEALLNDRMLDKEQKKFMKTMKTYPSVLRTEYAYALIVENDMEKADKLLKMFEKCALKYPYPNEITAERELIGKCREIVLTKKLKKFEKRC